VRDDIVSPLGAMCINVAWRTAGLDWRARKELVSLLVKLKQQLSLLVVSHDLRELEPIVDTAWEMHAGGRLEHKGRSMPVAHIMSVSTEVP
jgi:energy-coupling factor transporter ATP-binding protein EcfA2